MGVACLKFRGESFHGWLKNREIREKVFSLESFPLYSKDIFINQNTTYGASYMYLYLYIEVSTKVSLK